MRLLALIVLSVSVMVVGCNPPAPAPTTPSTPSSGSDTSSGATTSAIVPTNVQYVSLRVEDMHCPHGCFPTVKETLEGQPGVASVELAAQKSEDAIDNPEVKVQLNGDFDPAQAVAALKKAGFTGQVLN